MPLLRIHHSHDNLDDSLSSMKDLLDSVERNQKNGIYLRGRRYEDVNVSVPSQSFQSSQFESWNPMRAENELKPDLRQSATTDAHRSFFRRTKSYSPTRNITLRFVSKPVHAAVVHFRPLEQLRTSNIYNHVLSYDPINSSRQKLQNFVETRESTERDIRRKIAESHRDLATLKKLVNDTFGGSEYDYDTYRSTGIIHSGPDNIYGAEQSGRFKLDPEVLLNTVERRRRNSLPHAYYHEDHFRPINSTQFEETPITYDLLKETSTNFGTANGPTKVISINLNESHLREYTPLNQATTQMPFAGHLTPMVLDRYHAFEPRMRANYHWYNLPAYHYRPETRVLTSRYYHNDSSSEYDSLVPSLDLASARGYRLRPESSFFTVDKSRHNQLVRSKLPDSYKWQNVRGSTVAPHRRPVVFTGSSFNPRYHYEVIRNVTIPTYPQHDMSDLSDVDRMKLEKYELQSMHQPVRHHKPIKRLDYFENEPLHVGILDNEMIPHSSNIYYNSYTPYYTTLAQSNFRRKVTRPVTRIDYRTRSLPPTYRYQPEFVGSAVTGHKTRAETVNPSRNLITLDQVLREVEKSEDIHNHRFYGDKFYNVPQHHGAGIASYLRPPDNYEYYRQLYKKQQSKYPQEVYNYTTDYSNEFPSLYASKSEESYRPTTNTIYQDGQLFDQVNTYGDISTPPTRVTKPEVYLRRRTSEDYGRIISKQDFEPHFGFQRFSVV